MKKSKCRYCGRPVVWLVDANGKKQILDTVAPVYTVDGGDAFGPPDAPTHCTRHRGAFVSHFVTCAKRDEVKRS